MASMLEGMFSTPEDIRGARLDSLMNERRAISNSGGSWDQLLGQVAAGGGNFGGMLAEGVGGMFGLMTEEEKKAAEVQAMMSTALTKMDDPKAIADMARVMVERGYVKEGMALMQMRSERLADELTQERIDSSKRGVGQIVSVQTGNKPTGEPIYTYYKYNSTTGKMEKVGEGYTPYKPSSDIFGGLGGGFGADALPPVVIPDKGKVAAGAGKNNLQKWRSTYVALPEEQSNPYYIPKE